MPFQEKCVQQAEEMLMLIRGPVRPSFGHEIITVAKYQQVWKEQD